MKTVTKINWKPSLVVGELKAKTEKHEYLVYQKGNHWVLNVDSVEQIRGTYKTCKTRANDIEKEIKYSTTKFFDLFISEIKNEGILLVGEIGCNSEGIRYVVLQYPKDFRQNTNVRNGSVDTPVIMFDDEDEIEFTLGEGNYPEFDHHDGFGACRNIDELHDFTGVTEEDKAMYRNSK